MSGYAGVVPSEMAIDQGVVNDILPGEANAPLEVTNTNTFLPVPAPTLDDVQLDPFMPSARQSTTAELQLAANAPPPYFGQPGGPPIIIQAAGSGDTFFSHLGNWILVGGAVVGIFYFLASDFGGKHHKIAPLVAKVKAAATHIPSKAIQEASTLEGGAPDTARMIDDYRRNILGLNPRGEVSSNPSTRSLRKRVMRTVHTLSFEPQADANRRIVGPKRAAKTAYTVDHPNPVFQQGDGFGQGEHSRHPNTVPGAIRRWNARALDEKDVGFRPRLAAVPYRTAGDHPSSGAHTILSHRGLPRIMRSARLTDVNTNQLENERVFDAF